MSEVEIKLAEFYKATVALLKAMHDAGVHMTDKQKEELSQMLTVPLNEVAKKSFEATKENE